MCCYEAEICADLLCHELKPRSEMACIEAEMCFGLNGVGLI